ncbi:MAG: hypothetical protein F4X59_14995 [Holophagales bacterium]|nr:hypothetical protein [Holophagales bacterium]MYC11419.1 hypothetical protein [Holophagales bacterium]
MKRAERVLDGLRYEPTTLRTSEPTVSVRLTREPQPSPEAMVAVGLDPGFGLTPGWSDDYLIMFARTYAESHQNVVLLTADGPLSEHADEHPGITSIHLSRAHYEDWFLPDEPHPLQQRVAALEAALKDRVPLVSVSSGNDEELTAACVGGLTADEWGPQRRRLEAAFPEVTSFGFINPDSILLAAGHDIPSSPQLISATLEDMATYKSTHSDWLKSCESETAVLRRTRPCIRFAVCIENTGTAYAKTVEVTIDAHGCLLMDGSDESLAPLSPLDFDEVASHLAPPEAPPLSSGLLKQISVPKGPEPFLEPDLLARPGRERPPGQFEYTTDEPCSFQEKLSLDCPLWPHGREPVEIPLWIALERELVATKAQTHCAVSVRVEAENIPEPVHGRLPVKIAIRHESGVEHARRMVDTIIKHHARK